jgi:hypothetical protein
MNETTGADVGIDAFGVKANIKNVKSLNTILTFYVALVATVVAVFLGIHGVEAKDDAKTVAQQLKESNKEVAETLRQTTRESNAATKELVRELKTQNCLTVRIRPQMTATERAEERAFCAGLAR